MKNVEKFFVTVALFLFTATWLLFIFVFAKQNLLVFNQAQINSIPMEKSATVNSTDALSVPSTMQLSSTDSLKPLGKFIFSSSVVTISSKTEIKFEIPESASVEFYIKRVESSTEIYLGLGSILSGDTWVYIWDSTFTPNGNYYIIPYITNKYGRYTGSKIYMIVNNQAAQSVEQVAKLEDQLSSAKTSITEQEEKLLQTQNEINGLVSSKTENISNSANNAILPEKLSAVKGELNLLSSKITNMMSTSGVAINELSDKAKEVTDLIATSSGDVAKTEEIKKEVGVLISDSIGQLGEYFLEKQKLESAQKELAMKDSDNDDLSDQEEIRLKTDPFNPDTDGDGFLDGSEVKLGYDPLSASAADKLTYQNPNETLAPVSEDYIVDKIELVESPVNKEEKVLKIQGRAPANTFVTIYIYSMPTIVVTKADADGNWEYTLDKPLTDGRHTVYASVTNNTGDIEKISKAFDFAKAEDKIIKLLAPGEGTTESPSQNLNRVFIMMIAITVLLAVVFVVLVLGIYLKQHNK